MSSPEISPMPSPELFWETVNAYQRTQVLKAAIELDAFTAIAEGADTPAALAQRVGGTERAVRILMDHLTVLGFLTKSGGRYALTPDTSAFLDRRSRIYLGGVLHFMHQPTMLDGFGTLAQAIRTGRTTLQGEGSVDPENPVWVDFAQAMKPMMGLPAELIANTLNIKAAGPCRVLDIAAGHGMFGITMALHNPQAEITALDWRAVLAVARENAQKTGVADRFHERVGSAFEVDFGTGYDVVLLTNFLHHFDKPTCEGLLRKVHAALKPGGRVATLEFVPNEDRISPAQAAVFATIMLATTVSGDAYTFGEYQRMFANAGFARCELHELPPTPQRLVVSHK